MPKYKVSDYAMPDWRFGFCGPVKHGANLYALITNQSGLGEWVGVAKSTDGGQTWAEQDSVNHKGLADQNRASADCYVIGDTLRVYHTTTSGFLAVTDFDMATDTWGTTDVSSETISTMSVFGGYMGVCRSDGSDVILFQQSSGCRYVVRNGVGDWDASNSLLLAEMTVGIALGSDDRCHLLYMRSLSLYHQSLLADGDLGSASIVSSSSQLFSDLYSHTGEVYPFGRPLVIEGNLYVPSIISVRMGVPTLRVSIGTDTDDPTWTHTTPDPNRAAAFGGVSFSWGSMVDVEGVPWLVYMTFDNGYVIPNGIWVTRYVDGAWEEGVEVLPPEIKRAYEGISVGSIGSHPAAIFMYDTKTYYAELPMVSTPAAGGVIYYAY